MLSTVYISKRCFCNLFFVFDELESALPIQSESTESTPSQPRALGVSLQALEVKSNLSEILHIGDGYDGKDIKMRPQYPVTYEGMEEMLRVKLNGKKLNMDMLSEYITAACYIGAEINDIKDCGSKCSLKRNFVSAAEDGILSSDDDDDNIVQVDDLPLLVGDDDMSSALHKYSRDELLANIKYLVGLLNDPHNTCRHMSRLRNDILNIVGFNSIVEHVGEKAAVSFLSVTAVEEPYHILAEVPKWTVNAGLMSKTNVAPAMQKTLLITLNTENLIDKLISYESGWVTLTDDGAYPWDCQCGHVHTLGLTEHRLAKTTDERMLVTKFDVGAVGITAAWQIMDVVPRD